VLQANNKKNLKTGAIRPTGIYGHGDLMQFGKALEMFPNSITTIGNKDSRMDFTYIDNLVHAHVLLAARLLEESQAEQDQQSFTMKKYSGQAYAVSDNILTSGEMMQQVFEIAREKPLKVTYISMYIALAVAIALEVGCFALNSLKNLLYLIFNFIFTWLLCGLVQVSKPMYTAPPIARMYVLKTCIENYANTEKISKVLGYKHQVEPQECIKRTGEFYKQYLLELQQQKNKQV